MALSSLAACNGARPDGVGGSPDLEPLFLPVPARSCTRTEFIPASPAYGIRIDIQDATAPRQRSGIRLATRFGEPSSGFLPNPSVELQVIDGALEHGRGQGPHRRLTVILWVRPKLLR